MNASLSFVNGGGLSIIRTQAGVSIPVFVQPGNGTSGPKSMVLASANFGASFLHNEMPIDLPEQLYLAGGGIRVVRSMNDRWKVIGGININYQSDGIATSDVVNISGMGMFQWEKSERVQWMFGAVATGLEDLPVLPLVGFTWMPQEDWELSVGLPQTRVAHRVWWFGPHHEIWLYGGLAGVAGGSYGVRRNNGKDELLSIREFPLVVGLENRDEGLQWFVETGVVFGRELEFEASGEKESLGEGFFARMGIKY